ncbi:tail completion protein gp17 [Blastococcus mobilis]|uniref:tail completion protein gp17 n=1 Tax=Blastococcus mobilis TaxID=1938746 RepID=UPI001595078C|nr:DUF3168 domain-containing protein [Blastococcus mobilis]
MNAIAAATQHVVSRLYASAAVTAHVPAERKRIVQGALPNPEEAEYPLIFVLTYGDPVDTRYNNARRALTEVTVSVRVVMPADDLGPLVPIAVAVDEALDGTRGETATGTVVSCVRISETEMVDRVAGQTVRYLGGRYELLVS